MKRQDKYNLKTLGEMMEYLSDLGLQYRSQADVSKALNASYYSLGVTAEQIIKKMARDDELEQQQIEIRKKNADAKKSQ